MNAGWDRLLTWALSLEDAWVPWDYRRPDLWYTMVARPHRQLLRDPHRDLVLRKSHGRVVKIFLGRFTDNQRDAQQWLWAHLRPCAEAPVLEQLFQDHESQ